jgi:hypothetical protein
MRPIAGAYSAAALSPAVSPKGTMQSDEVIISH